MKKEPKNRNTYTAPLSPAHQTANLLKESFHFALNDLWGLQEFGEPGISLVAVNLENKEIVTKFVSNVDVRSILSVVVGRHGAADLVISSDEALSLRQAIVLLGADSDQNLICRVLDLRSSTGMADAEGQLHFSVASNGPMALRLADTALFVIPSGTVLPETDDEDAFSHVEWPQAVPWVPDKPPERHISLVSMKTNLTSMVSMPPPTLVGPSSVDSMGLAPPTIGKIKFELGKSNFDFNVDVVSMRTGVLVGRYPRCDLNEDTTEIPLNVSRIHALFITVDQKNYVFDVGSLNGLTYEDYPVRLMPLPERMPCKFDIAKDVAITWWPNR